MLSSLERKIEFFIPFKSSKFLAGLNALGLQLK